MNNKNQKLFRPQQFSHAVENEIIANNIAIDIAYGHRDLIAKFLEGRSDLDFAGDELMNSMTRTQNCSQEKARRNSVLMTVAMLTGKCNADCPICYTDRKQKPNGLTIDEVREIVDQTYELGSRLLYIPGEGEPTIDPMFMDLLDHCRKRGVAVIVFTNGIIFSNDRECRRVWGVDGDTFLRGLSDYPVYFYHKLWSLKPSLLSEMMNIHESSYQWDCIRAGSQTFNVPKGIVRLLRHFPIERVGIECVVESRNIDEVIHDIIPFVEATKVKSYIEPIIHAGRCFDFHKFDVSPADLVKLGPWLARQTCRRTGYKCTVHNDGLLSPGISITWQRILGRNEASKFSIRESGNVRELFEMLHTLPELVQARYMSGGCLCEELNLRLASGIKHPFGDAYTPQVRIP